MAWPNDMLPDLRLALRVASEDFDGEIQMLAESAIADMLRVGVSEDYVEEYGPRVRNAVYCYVKANFGFDNQDAARLDASYRQIVVDMLNSDANAAAGGGGE